VQSLLARIEGPPSKSMQLTTARLELVAHLERDDARAPRSCLQPD
jgi:hypothetical protein